MGSARCAILKSLGLAATSRYSEPAVRGSTSWLGTGEDGRSALHGLRSGWGGTALTGDQSETAGLEALEPVVPPDKPDWRLPAAIVGIAFLAFVVLVIALLLGGWLQKPKTDKGVSTLGPILTLVGTFLVQLLVAAGLVLKHSIELRTYQLARYEKHRLALDTAKAYELQLHEQSQLDLQRKRDARETELERQRLTTDTIIKAVTLFSNAQGEPSSPAQQAGAIRALLHLNEAEMALALVDQGWKSPVRPLEAPSAVGLIDSILMSKVSNAVKQSASSILLAHAEAMYIGGDDAIFPDSIESHDWFLFEPAVRFRLLLCLAKLAGSRLAQEKEVPSNTVRWILAVLAEFVSIVDHQRNCLIAACIGEQLVRVLREDQAVIVGKREYRPAELRSQFSKEVGSSPCPLAVKDHVDRIHAWADRIVLALNDESDRDTP